MSGRIRWKLGYQVRDSLYNVLRSDVCCPYLLYKYEIAS